MTKEEAKEILTSMYGDVKFPSLCEYLSEDKDVETSILEWFKAVDDVVNRLPDAHSACLKRFVSPNNVDGGYGCSLTYDIRRDLTVEHSFNGRDIETTIKSVNEFTDYAPKFSAAVDLVKYMTHYLFKHCIMILHKHDLLKKYEYER